MVKAHVIQEKVILYEFRMYIFQIFYKSSNIEKYVFQPQELKYLNKEPY